MQSKCPVYKLRTHRSLVPWAWKGPWGIAPTTAFGKKSALCPSSFGEQSETGNKSKETAPLPAVCTQEGNKGLTSSNTLNQLLPTTAAAVRKLQESNMGPKLLEASALGTLVWTPQHMGQSARVDLLGATWCIPGALLLLAQPNILVISPHFTDLIKPFRSMT